MQMTPKTEKCIHKNPTMNPSCQYFLHPLETGLKKVVNVFRGTKFKGWKRVVTAGDNLNT